MAELPKNIRKVGGEMVAARSPFTRRVLLPTEADLCNALGITEEEYFQFLEGVAAKVKEQPEAYGLVPEIFAGPGAGALALWKTAAAGGGLTLLGQVAVGVALSVISYLLTPKPKSMKQGTAERTADIAGMKRFAPQFSFNSVQELANLGDLIPLVFTNYQEIIDASKGTSQQYGGVRVNSQLMWSQLVSLGRFQQLKIFGLFSLGTIEEEPEYKGYAIGDLLIENYQKDKIFINPATGEIPFKTSGGLFSDENIDEFQIDNANQFSGARNPTTQAIFGLSSPMPNLTYFRLPYELVRAPSKLDADNRPAARITTKKRRKLLGGWPMRAGFADGGNGSQKSGNTELDVDTFLTYQVAGGSDDPDSPDYDANAWQPDWDGYDPHGVEDVNAVTKTVREATDSYIAEGEQYMAGTALVSCTEIFNEDWPGHPWDGYDSDTRNYQFKVIETGFYECASSPNLGTHCNNPQWKDGTAGKITGDFFEVKDHKYYYEQYYDQYQLYEPCKRYVLQKTTLGTVSDNRNCHITEIGLKSKVFKQMSFANVNSKPTEEEIEKVYNDRSTLSLGNVNKYITRYSFFKLQIRISGTEDDWKTLKPSSPSNHLGLFCIKGNTPEFQYTYVRIDHPYEQYEYRFFPWPGNDVIKQVEQRGIVEVNLLNANGATDPDAIHEFICGDNNQYTVKFAGRKDCALDKNVLSNIEWDFGEPSANRRPVPGIVQGVKTGHYASPSHVTKDIFQNRTNEVKFTKIYHPDCSYPTTYPGYGNHTIIVQYKNWPSDGVSTFSLYVNENDVTPNVQGRGANGGAWGDDQTPTDLTLTNLSASDGGGQTIAGVQFHYSTSDGRGGKFIPVRSTSISGNINGYPCGKVDLPMFGNVTKTYWYVRKIEDVFISGAPPLIDTFIYPDSEDEDENSIADGSNVRFSFRLWSNDARDKVYAEWDLDSNNRGQNYKEGNKVRIRPKEDPNDDEITLMQSQIVELVVSNTFEKQIASRLNLYDAAADYWKYEGDQSSHLEGPEHQIVYCNEIVRTEDPNGIGFPIEGSSATYENLAYAGLKINSSKEWTNFSQFSGYFKKGIKVPDLINSPATDKASNLFPELAYALLTDKKLGAGAVISTSSVNKINMGIAAKFCKANNFYWDGVISNKVNLREFIFEQATQCLLDFTIIGGQFSLYPAVPFDENNYLMLPEKAPVIKAMFTDGNIKDLNVAFLNPEDRQTFQANVLYRQEKLNGFSETKSVVVRLLKQGAEDDPLETFDLSGFCTSLKHATNFGKYVLGTREKVDHTITFKTAPHYINGVQPGDYIRVFSTTQHVNRFNNGAILDDGTVVSKDTISGSKTFYYWNPSEEVVKEATADFSTPSSIQPFAGSLFTIKESEASDQCYKVESITFGEDGLIELSGSYAPLTDNGKLAILDQWNSGRFLVQS